MTTQAAALAAFQADADLDAARRRLGDALPAEGWLADYLRAVTPLTDTPVEFSLAAGLCALASALGNSLWYETWGQRVYPHLWVILVAPSSFWRKSTAINLAERLVAEADETRVLPSDFSREKFLEELSARAVGMLSLKEFGGFLANLSRDYMSGTREMLTELYDGPEMYNRALKGRTYTVRRPAVTLLAATTLDWFESRVTEGDLRGGFLGRFLFVTATEKASPKGLTGGMDGLVRMHLRDDLRSLATVPEQEVSLEPEARQLLNDWLAGWESEVTESHHVTDLTGFAVRLQTYALKLAVLYRASAVVREAPADVVQISAEDLGRAIAYCRILWANVTALIDEDIALTRQQKTIRSLKRIVGAGITRGELMRRAHLGGKREFDDYLAALIESGELVVEQRRASELGIERQRDTTIQWVRLGFGVRPYGSQDGSGSQPSGSQVAGGANSKREPQAADLSTESPSSSHYLSLSPSIEIHTRAKGETEGEEESTPKRELQADEESRWD